MRSRTEHMDLMKSMWSPILELCLCNGVTELQFKTLRTDALTKNGSYQTCCQFVCALLRCALPCAIVCVRTYHVLRQRGKPKC